MSGMQIKRVGYGVRGFGRVTSYAIRWLRMVTDKAKQKLKILAFWERYGLKATVDSFGVKRRTLYDWKAKLKAGDGRPEALNEKSKAPKRMRKREWDSRIVAEIRRVRETHPNLGKEKVHVHLQAFAKRRGIACPSPRTVGRIIADAPDRMRTYPQKVRHDGKVVRKKMGQVLRKPKGFRAVRPGHCVALDTIEIIIWGRRVYVVTMVDLYSRFALAHVTRSHASLAAKEFFNEVHTQFPHEIEHVLTDNGSEFMKHFDAELRRLCLTHWHTYPKTPKMNAHCERFNRTVKEEFLITKRHLLLEPDRCNEEMGTWLDWYNNERPHWGIDLVTPVQYLRNHQLKSAECNM